MTFSPFQPADLERFTDIAEVHAAPDTGGRVAVATTRADLPSNAYERRVIVIDVADGSEVTTGLPAGARLPRWSPDGTGLAVVLPDAEGSRIAVVRDGAVHTVCTTPDPVEELTWSPDGQLLLFVARVPLDREYWTTPVERRPPLRLTRLHYQEDTIGVVAGRPRQAFLVPSGGGQPLQLSAGGFDDAEFSWLPDSSGVVFVSQRHDERERTLLNDVFVQDLASGEARALTATQFCFGTPVVSPDGTTLAVTTMDVQRFPANVEIATMPMTGGSPTVLTTALDRDCSELTWHGDNAVTAVIADAGSTHFYEIAVPGGDPRLVLGGQRRVGPVAWLGDALVHAVSSATKPPRLVIADRAGERTLYAPNDTVLGERRVHEPRHRRVPTAPGVEVDSWLTLPDGAGPWPLLVCLQGGGTQYGQLWSHEFQLLNANGFATLCLNARGSGGYGQAWARTVSGPAADPPGSGWGTVDVDDVAAVVQATLREHPELDATRVGVQGGSYGALVTTWLLARTDLFAAGWAERGPYNVHSLAGSNDESPWFFDTYLGVSQLEDPAAYWTPSPLRVAPSITAPLAIVHSELDRRCPIQQAEELFMALRVAGREVEFIRFPGESHELTRSGSPVHRLQRLEILLEWFGRWLRPVT